MQKYLALDLAPGFIAVNIQSSITGEQPPRARFLFRCEQRLLVFPVGFRAVVKKQMLDACACQSQLSLRPTPWMLHRLK